MSDIISTASLASYMNNQSMNSSVANSVTAAVNQWIENRTNRCWGETTTTNERRDWSPLIYTYHQDVVSVNSIILGYPNLPQTTLDPTSYFYNSLGRITIYLQQPGQYNPSSVNNDLVLINYTYGVEQVPDDLTEAALAIAGAFYNFAATTGLKDVVSASIGTFKLQFAGSVRGAASPDGKAVLDPAKNVTDAHWQIIDSYKMRKL